MGWRWDGKAGRETCWGNHRERGKTGDREIFFFWRVPLLLEGGVFSAVEKRLLTLVGEIFVEGSIAEKKASRTGREREGFWEGKSGENKESIVSSSREMGREKEKRERGSLRGTS